MCAGKARGADNFSILFMIAELFFYVYIYVCVCAHVHMYTKLHFVV